MDEKHCGNCGAKLAEGERFCHNCGADVTKFDTEDSADQISENPKVTRISLNEANKLSSNAIKNIIWIVGLSVLLLAVVGAGYYIHVKENNDVNVTNIKKAHSKGSARIERKNNSSNSKKSAMSEYSTKEWVLMGYISYARKNYNADSTSDLISQISSDLKDGTMTVQKKDSQSYTFTNRYGSVDVKVDANEVEVTNDGDTVTSKTELKQQFAGYSNRIKNVVDEVFDKIE